jgi:hypothetical protein
VLGAFERVRAEVCQLKSGWDSAQWAADTKADSTVADRLHES